MLLSLFLNVILQIFSYKNLSTSFSWFSVYRSISNINFAYLSHLLSISPTRIFVPEDWEFLSYLLIGTQNST